MALSQLTQPVRLLLGRRLVVLGVMRYLLKRAFKFKALVNFSRVSFRVFKFFRAPRSVENKLSVSMSALWATPSMMTTSFGPGALNAFSRFT